jgi:hypothetical protein
MKSWQFAVLGLSLLATLGCRSDPAIPLLERELRHKEDEVYRLRGKVEDLQDSLNYLERHKSSDSDDSSADSSRDSNRDSRSSENRSSENRSSRPPAAGKPPKIDMGSGGSSEVPDLLKVPAGTMTPPEVPDALKNATPPLDKGARSSMPAEEMVDAPEAMGAEGPMLGAPPVAPGDRSMPKRPSPKNEKTTMRGASGDSRRVASISLNSDLTGGLNDGKHPGDKGLLVVVEPRDASGRVIEAPANVVVSVLDPALEGEAARVARWEFTPAQTASMFRHTNGGSALHIETAWPNGAPAHSNLHVYVRYVTADGRKVETNQPIEIASARDKPGRAAPNEASAWSDDAGGRQPMPTPVAQRPMWSPERR